MIQQEYAALRPEPRLQPVVVENPLGEWRRLRQSITRGRALLQRILIGCLVFMPTSGPRKQGYNFHA